MQQKYDASVPARRAANFVSLILPADKAAQQIMKAVESGKNEAYVGKPGQEKLALIINRLAPGLLKKMVKNKPPK